MERKVTASGARVTFVTCVRAHRRVRGKRTAGGSRGRSDEGPTRNVSLSLSFALARSLPPPPHRSSSARGVDAAAAAIMLWFPGTIPAAIAAAKQRSAVFVVFVQGTGPSAVG